MRASRASQAVRDAQLRASALWHAAHGALRGLTHPTRCSQRRSQQRGTQTQTRVRRTDSRRAVASALRAQHAKCEYARTLKACITVAMALQRYSPTFCAPWIGLPSLKKRDVVAPCESPSDVEWRLLDVVRLRCARASLEQDHAAAEVAPASSEVKWRVAVLSRVCSRESSVPLVLDELQVSVGAARM